MSKKIGALSAKMIDAAVVARESKHAPGPWVIEDECHLDHEGVITITGPGKSYIASIHTEDGDDHVEDAHLIAAAPELLAACRAMIDAMDDFLHVDENGDNSGDLNTVSNQLPKLRAAIAKAEGH